ncbi:hypothetical protein [Bacillus cereus]|uniref:hypothetical protein n=1 Tax=Bacillus cereus TaxID=1396 RepID=UPI000330B7CA|nr:hypothetical protein [Bacillus cereus]EOO44143.1 hypothetical protein ICK_06400 [Bacillus cereus BAG1X2-2]EOP00273.1 hypothetical protein ICO_06229 [Bacillus cereus BAG2O-1]
MSEPWEVFYNEISPRIKEVEGLEFKMTCYTPRDWDGVGVDTNKGMIHILSDGTVIDENNLLGER